MIPYRCNSYVILYNIGQGNLGNSIRFGRPVVDIISERLPMTIELTICAMLFSSIIGIFLGIVSAVRRGSWVDTVTMIWANIGVSMPVFWLGLMLAYVFALLLKGTPFFIPPSGRFSSGISLTPLLRVWHMEDATGFVRFAVNFLSNMVLFNSLVTGNWSQFKDELWHLILPAVAVGTIPLSIIARMTRSSLLEVLGLDYIRTARAKGLRQSIGHHETCPAQRADPHCHHHRASNRRLALRRHPDRNRIFAARRRDAVGCFHPGARLPCCAGIYH